MVSLTAAYWMGLNAAESARVDRQMWEIASRATRSRVAAPDLDWEPLIEQINHLQAQLQQARAGWQQNAADGERCFDILRREAEAHDETKWKLMAAEAEIHQLRNLPPF